MKKPKNKNKEFDHADIVQLQVNTIYEYMKKKLRSEGSESVTYYELESFFKLPYITVKRRIEVLHKGGFLRSERIYSDDRGRYIDTFFFTEEKYF